MKTLKIALAGLVLAMGGTAAQAASTSSTVVQNNSNDSDLGNLLQSS